MTNQTITTAVHLGDVAQVLAAPGYPTDTHVIVWGIDGRAVTMIDANGAQETFTLRRNGKYAAKGSSQWTNYLRFLPREW